MQSSFSLGFSDKDRAWTCSLPKVKKYVVAIWRDTNRLTTLDVHQLLTEMFYHVSQAPTQMKRLGAFWLELLDASRAGADAVLPRPKAADAARLRRGLRGLGCAAARHLPLHPLAARRALR